IRNSTSLTADRAHNEQCELPVADTSVVLVQVAQRRQTLRTEKVELLDQRSQLQQFAFREVVVEKHFRLRTRNRLMRLPAGLDGRFECNAKSLLHSVIETGQVTFKTVQEPCGSTTTQDLHVFVQQLRTLLHSQLFTGKGPLQLLELGFEFTGFRGQVVESGGNAVVAVNGPVCCTDRQPAQGQNPHCSAPRSQQIKDHQPCCARHDTAQQHGKSTVCHQPHHSSANRPVRSTAHGCSHHLQLFNRSSLASHRLAPIIAHQRRAPTMCRLGGLSCSQSTQRFI